MRAVQHFRHFQSGFWGLHRAPLHGWFVCVWVLENTETGGLLGAQSKESPNRPHLDYCGLGGHYPSNLVPVYVTHKPFRISFGKRPFCIVITYAVNMSAFVAILTVPLY